MKKLIYSAFTLLIAYPIYAAYSPGTVIIMDRRAAPAAVSQGNENGCTWSDSIGSGGGVNYSTWLVPQPFGGITSAGAGNVLLSTSAAADWKGNGVFFRFGTNLNLRTHWQITQVTPGVDFTVTPSTSYFVNAATGVVANGAMNLGGACSGGSVSFAVRDNTFDEIFDSLVASSTLYIKPGYYQETLVTQSALLMGQSTPAYVIGVNEDGGNSLTPFGPSTSAPTIDMAANAFTAGSHTHLKNLKMIGSAATAFSYGLNALLRNLKTENYSTTPNRVAASVPSGGIAFMENCEIVSYNGGAVLVPSGSQLIAHGNWIHSSSTGLYVAGTSGLTVAINNVFSSNRYGVSGAAVAIGAGIGLINNTFIGNDAFKNSTHTISVASSTIHTLGNIFANAYSARELRHLPMRSFFNSKDSYYGLISTVSRNTVFNPFDLPVTFLDTTTAYGIDPQFTDVTELSATTATTNGTQIVMHGGGFFENAGITDRVDMIQLHYPTLSSATAKIIGHSSFSVTTDGSFGTSTTADKKFTIRIGKKFGLNGTNLKAKAAYTVAGSTGTSYMDIGAFQREEQTCSGGGGSSGCSAAYWR